MWAAPGDGLNMRTLWTDTPYAMQRVAGLYEANEINAEERDDLAHFVEHGWLVWRSAIEPDLIDRFAADIRAHHLHPKKFLTTNHRNNESLRLLRRRPQQAQSARNLSKPWRSAGCFFGALGQDGHIVVFYQFVGGGKLPQGVALPRCKGCVGFQVEIVVDRLGEGLICTIKLALGLLGLLGGARVFVVRPYRKDNCKSCGHGRDKQRRAKPTGRLFRMTVPFLSGLLRMLLRQHLLFGRRPQFSFRRRSCDGLARGVLGGLLSVPLRVGDSLLVRQFSLALGVFFCTLSGEPIVLPLDRAGNKVADIVDRHVAGVAK